MTTALPSSCEELQSNNQDEYSDDSDAESEKVTKAKKKSKKPGNEKWSGSLIPRLWRPTNSSQMSSCITAQLVEESPLLTMITVTKIVAIVALLG